MKWTKIRIVGIPIWLFVFVMPVMGYLFGIASYYVGFYLFEDVRTTEMLMELSDDVIGIDRVSIWGGDYDIYPMLATSSGEVISPLYSYRVLKTYAYEHGPCSNENLKAIEREAGPVIDCKQGRPGGEWDPPPYYAYAITESGELWLCKQKTVSPRILGYSIQGSCKIFAVIGLLIFLGVSAFWLLTRVLDKSSKKR